MDIQENDPPFFFSLSMEGIYSLHTYIFQEVSGIPTNENVYAKASNLILKRGWIPVDSAFDKAFNYERDFKDSWEYQYTMKHGTEEQISMLWQKNNPPNKVIESNLLKDNKPNKLGLNNDNY